MDQVHDKSLEVTSFGTSLASLDVNLKSSSQPSPPGNNVFAQKIEQIEILLECPVCFNGMEPPVVNCMNGHNVCGRCLPKLIKCPICSSGFTTTRNILVESIQAVLKSTASAVRIPCPFASEGCNVRLIDFEIQLHASKCFYRDIKCRMQVAQVCQDTMLPYSHYFNHLKEIHKIEGIKLSASMVCIKDYELNVAVNIDTDTQDFSPFYIMVNQVILLQRCLIHEGQILWWFSIVAPPTIAKRYNATLQLISPTSKTVFTRTVSAIPFRSATKSAVLSGSANEDVIITGTSVLREIWKKDGWKFNRRYMFHRWSTKSIINEIAPT